MHPLHLPYGETGVRPWGSGWGTLNRETPGLLPFLPPAALFSACLPFSQLVTCLGAATLASSGPSVTSIHLPAWGLSGMAGAGWPDSGALGWPPDPRSSGLHPSTSASPRTLPPSQFVMTQEWGLDAPNLLISVTGGAKDFNMKPRLKSVFEEDSSRWPRPQVQQGQEGPRPRPWVALRPGSAGQVRGPWKAESGPRIASALVGHRVEPRPGPGRGVSDQTHPFPTTVPGLLTV